MIITHCFFEMENYYVAADYRAPDRSGCTPMISTKIVGNGTYVVRG